MNAKYPIGIRVDFLNSRYMDEEHKYYPYNLKYNEGNGGFVIAVSDEPIFDENTGLNEYHYTIKVGMSDIMYVPESDLINPNASISSKVEQRLREKQANKEFKDTEGRVGGSKKEKRAYKIISLEDLKNIEEDEATAIELIKKDRIYPKVNVNLEIENGVSSGTAFLKVKMREVYPAQPINTKRRDVYIGFANFNIEYLNKVYTSEQFQTYLTDINNNIYYILMNIVDPNLFEEVNADNELKEGIRQDLQKQLDVLINDLNAQKLILKNKYPMVFGDSFYSFRSNVLKIDNYEDTKAYYNIVQETDLIEDKLDNLEKEVNNSNIEFAESIIGKKVDKYSLRNINRLTIEAIFGKKFWKFINKVDPFDKTFDLAFDYDPLSEIESKIAIDKYSQYDIDRQNKLNKYIEESSKIYDFNELKAYLIANCSYSFKGGEFGNRYFSAKDIKNIGEAEKVKDRWYSVLKEEIKKISDKLEKTKYIYRERENNWEWFTKAKPTKSSSEKAELVINTLPPLHFIKRVGGYAITESDINPTFIKEKFGFKDVEFGQSLKDKEAKEHIRHFLGGMADLGDILDLDIIKLNKIGGLSIAFASRGSGKALAHYDGLRKIINITKSRGGGALAHEYMHYIDNIVPKINRSDYNYKDWSSVQKSSKYKSSRKIDDFSVSNAYDDIFDYIYKRILPYSLGGTYNREALSTEVLIPKSDADYLIPSSFYNGNFTNIEEYIPLFFSRYPKYEQYEQLNKKTKEILGSIVKKFGLEEYKFKLKTYQTMFYAKSLAMKSDYWTREWELFARAFETYIFDKLAKVGRSNNYLVSGEYFDREEGVYPQGKEREDLFILYDRLIEVMKKTYDLGGFKSWTTERVDEYFALEDNGDEQTGVIVDEETGELVEKVGEYTELQQKFIKLAKMLKSKNNKKKK